MAWRGPGIGSSPSSFASLQRLPFFLTVPASLSFLAPFLGSVAHPMVPWPSWSRRSPSKAEIPGSNEPAAIMQCPHNCFEFEATAKIPVGPVFLPAAAPCDISK